MQFRRAAAQPGRGGEIDAHMISRELGWRTLRKLGRVLQLGRRGIREWERSAFLVIALHLFESPLPCVPFVRYKPLQHGERRRFAFGRCILDGTGERWSTLEMRLPGQVSPYFNIGIRTRLLTPEQLQNQPVIVKNGSCALLRGRAPYRQRIGPAYLFERGARLTAHYPPVHRRLVRILNQPKEGGARAIVVDTVV